jgi:hypothetical protein
MELFQKTGCAALLKKKNPPRKKRHQLRGPNEPVEKRRI